MHMASFLQKAMWALGLTDEQTDEATNTSASSAKTSTADSNGGDRAVVSENRVGLRGRTGNIVSGRRVEPPMTRRRMVSENPKYAEAGVYVRNSVSASTTHPIVEKDQVEVIEARAFSDAQLLADHIRSGTPVVLDLRGAETAMVRRLVDFSSGLTYGLAGKMVKIARGVILVSPANVVIGLEERRRLADLGLHSAPNSE